jgi:hypothetical protein
MQGQLFTQDFLLHGIKHTPPYQGLTGARLAQFRDELTQVFEGVSGEQDMAAWGSYRTRDEVLRVLALLGMSELSA